MAEGEKIGRTGLPRGLQGSPRSGGRVVVGKNEEGVEKGLEGGMWAIRRSRRGGKDEIIGFKEGVKVGEQGRNDGGVERPAVMGEGGMEAGGVEVIRGASRRRGGVGSGVAEGAEVHGCGEFGKTDRGRGVVEACKGAMVLFVGLKKAGMVEVKVVEEGAMESMMGEGLCGVVEVNVVVGNPTRGMDFEPMGEFRSEGLGNVCGEIQVGDTACMLLK